VTDEPTPGRWLEAMRIDALVPALHNPKKHDIDSLRASVARFGFTSPPEMDERTGRLVVGHGRVQLLQLDMAAKLPVPEGIEVDEDGTWKVYVLRGWSSANDTEAQAYLIANNRQAELGGLEQKELAPLLLEELTEVPDGDGLAAIGFTVDDTVDILKSLLPPSNRSRGGQDQSDELSDSYAVVVTCADETEQLELIERLSADGLECRALVS
jgi:hypothetical protein